MEHHRLTAALAVSATLATGLAFAQPAPRSSEARVARVQGTVDVAGPAAHAARAGESLAAGARVITRAGASADLTFADDARLALREGTTLVLFASATRPPPGAPARDDTTLVRGTVHADAAAGAAHPLTLATPGVLLTVQGAALIAVDASRATRITVQRGRVRVHAGNRDVIVRAGNGTRVDAGRPAPPPQPLYPAPRWTQPPPPSTLTGGEPADIRGTFRATTAVPPLRWHVQLARDEAFDDVVIDRTQPATATDFDAPQLAPGSYFARVSGVDHDRLEGAASAPVPITVASPRVLPGGDGRRASVEIARGFYCGLDGGPLAPTGSALSLAPGHEHRLRCGPSADGAGAREVTIGASQAGPLVHRVRIEPGGFDGGPGQRTLVLELADGAGVPISDAAVRVTPSEGATLTPLREGDRRGTYTSTIIWRRGLPGVRLHFVIDGGEAFDYALGGAP